MQSINQKINFKPDFVCYASATGASTVNKEYKIIEQIQKQLKNPPYFFDNSNHHLYHALSCFYFSKFDEAAAIIQMVVEQYLKSSLLIEKYKQFFM